MTPAQIKFEWGTSIRPDAVVIRSQSTSVSATSGSIEADVTCIYDVVLSWRLQRSVRNPGMSESKVDYAFWDPTQRLAANRRTNAGRTKQWH